MNLYIRLLTEEQEASDYMDFSNPDHEYSFGNLCEEVIFKARNSLDTVKTEKKPFSILLTDIGHQWLINGRFFEAEICFEKALQWNPANMTARIRYLHYLLEMQNLVDFEEIARDGFLYVFRPEDFDNLYEAVRKYFEITDNTSSILSQAELKEKLEKRGFSIYSNDEISALFLKYAKEYAKENQIQNAIDCYQAAYDIYPEEDVKNQIKCLKERGITGE